jgi:hypothetical protein
MNQLRRDSVFAATDPLPAARAAERKAQAKTAIRMRLNARTVICMARPPALPTQNPVCLLDPPDIFGILDTD